MTELFEIGENIVVTAAASATSGTFGCCEILHKYSPGPPYALLYISWRKSKKSFLWCLAAIHIFHWLRLPCQSEFTGLMAAWSSCADPPPLKWPSQSVNFISLGTCVRLREEEPQTAFFMGISLPLACSRDVKLYSINQSFPCKIVQLFISNAVWP